MANIYSIEVKLCATAYIRANSPEEAIELAKQNYGEGTGEELPTDDVSISGRGYGDPRLPDASLSPAVSYYGPFDGGEWSVELAEEDVPEHEVD